MSVFQTTRWSLLLTAGTASIDAQVALSELCRIYRPAVIAYLRMTGHNREDADDLAQSFFLRFLEKRLHQAADRERGRFRVFLKTALSNYVSNLKAAERAERRGGAVHHLGLDDADQASLLAEPDSDNAPEQAFERAFALTLLERAMQRLAEESSAAGKRDLFDALREFIAEAPDVGYEAIAAKLGMRGNTVAVAVHRLRQRLRELVKGELADVVATPDQVETEMKALREAIDGRSP